MPPVLKLRKRQMRNILATLFLSQGVPMLQAGDEFARTQRATTTPTARTTRFPGSIGICAAVNQDLLPRAIASPRLRRRMSSRRETFLKGAAVARQRQGCDVVERRRHRDEAE